MKIAIVADSHGDVSMLVNKLDLLKDCDLLIHLGDYDSDVDQISKFLDIKMEVVRGNNDYSSRFDKDKVLNIEGHKIFLTHGNNYNVYFGLERLYYKAKDLGADIVLYGHTHYYYYEDLGDVKILNPGSLSLPRDDKKSFVIMEIDQADVKIKRIEENT
ncbi:MAG: metallophosphoesterase [Tissierellia bacterium]|nr:metallophosphoesterase [Tissierellia bacterium]